MLSKNNTFIDMFRLSYELNKGAMDYDNSVIRVNGCDVLIKVTSDLNIIDINNISRYYSINYIYDTGIESSRATTDDYRFTDECYEVVRQYRIAIEDVLLDLVYDNELVGK